MDRFYQCEQPAFELRHARTVRERSYPTGVAGRPSATEMCLFTSTELRDDDEPVSETCLGFGISGLENCATTPLAFVEIALTRSDHMRRGVNLILSCAHCCAFPGKRRLDLSVPTTFQVTLAPAPRRQMTH